AGAEIARLDPKAFEAVMRAADQGLVLDAAKVRDIVAPALERGALKVERADGSFAVAGGQLRLSTTILRGNGGELSVGGNLDLAERQIDARLTLSGVAPEGSDIGKPDLHLALRGPVAAPRRTIDATALTAWLTLRSVDRETKRIDAIEAAAREPPREPAATGTAPARPA